MPPITKKFLVENIKKLIVLSEDAGEGMERQALDTNNPMLFAYGTVLKNNGHMLRALLKGQVILTYKEWEERIRKEHDNTEVV